MQLGKFDEAEKYLLKALSKSSSDVTTLQVERGGGERERET